MGGPARGPTGRDYPAASPRTGGPMGTKMDAADPSTPPWFLGETKGPLGHQDHADPNIKMCSLQAYLHNKWLKEYNFVKQELKETYRLRDAYGDKKLLQEADEKGWDASEFDKKVKEKLFGGSTKGKDYVNPMYTDPYRGEQCRIIENWSLETYLLKGFPKVIYQADRAHEESHLASCTSESKNPLVYGSRMTDARYFSQDEIKAYNAKIKILEKWLHDNPAPKVWPFLIVIPC